MLVWAAGCMGFFRFLCCSEFLDPHNAPFDPKFTYVCLTYVTSAQTCTTIWRSTLRPQRWISSASAQLLPWGYQSRALPGRYNFVLSSSLGGTSPAPYLSTTTEPLYAESKKFVSKIQHALHLAGVSELHFNCHSFWIGAATLASQSKVPETTITLVGS